MSIRAVSLIILFGIIVSPSARLGAQKAPCGIDAIKLGGEKDEVRFIPAAMDYVQDSVKRALPSVGAQLTNEEPGHIEAMINFTLFDIAKNRAFGSEGIKGNGAMGKLHIKLAPATQDGVQGTTVNISFSRGGLGSDRYGTPLADETACLVKTLSPIDSTTYPSGAEILSPGSATSDVSVRAGTPVKVALRNRLYTMDFQKSASTIDVVLQVIEDVQINNSTVIRKGALAKGKVIEWQGPQNFYRNGSLKFTVQSVTAVDGQEIPLAEYSTADNGSSKASIAGSIAVGGLLGGMVGKGKDVFVRAGTSWELPTSKDVLVKAQH